MSGRDKAVLTLHSSVESAIYPWLYLSGSGSGVSLHRVHDLFTVVFVVLKKHIPSNLI